MIKLNHLQRPRYIDDTKTKLTNFLTDDFQSDIKDELIKAIAKLNITGNMKRKDVTIVVQIQANRDYRLIGLLKNLLDAFQEVLYIDDSEVKSVLIYRIPAEYEHKDRMRICVLENIVVRGCQIDEVTLANNTVVATEFDTVLEDNYLLYQEGMEVSEEVFDDTRVLGESLFGDMAGMVEDAEVSIRLITDTTKRDIDNVALNVVASMERRAVRSVEDIKVLNIYRESDRRRRGSMRVEVEIGKDGKVVYKKGDCYINKRPVDINNSHHQSQQSNSLQNNASEAERRKPNG